ncbi:MAG: hypothetical protein GY719_10075 [bacterium]|nr:hypothetical protein [bacterium]
MGAKIKVGSFVAATSGSSQNVTVETGFGAPSGVIFWAGSATADDTLTAHVMTCIGAMAEQGASFQNYTAAVGCEDAQGTTDMMSRAANNAALLMIDPVNHNVELEMLYSSTAHTDGFQVLWNVNPPNGKIINYIAFGGDIECKLAIVTPIGFLNSTVNVDVGFEPDGLVVFGTGKDQFTDTETTDAELCVGICANDGSETQKCASYKTRDQVGSGQAGAYSRGDRVYSVAKAQPGTEEVSYEVTAFAASPNSFTVATRTAGATRKFAAFAFRCPSGEEVLVHEYNTGSLSPATVTLTTTEEADAAFILQAAGLLTEIQYTAANNCNWFSIGAISVDHAGERMLSSQSGDAIGTSIDKNRTDADYCSYIFVENNGNQLERQRYGDTRTATTFEIDTDSGDSSGGPRVGFALTIGREASSGANLSSAVTGPAGTSAATLEADLELTSSVTGPAGTSAASLEVDLDLSSAVTGPAGSGAATIDVQASLSSAVVGPSASGSASLAALVSIEGAATGPAGVGTATLDADVAITSAAVGPSPSAAATLDVDLELSSAAIGPAGTSAATLDVQVDLSSAVSGPVGSGAAQLRLGGSLASAVTGPPGTGAATLEAELELSSAGVGPAGTAAAVLSIDDTLSLSSAVTGPAGTGVADLEVEVDLSSAPVGPAGTAAATLTVVTGDLDLTSNVTGPVGIGAALLGVENDLSSAAVGPAGQAAGVFGDIEEEGLDLLLGTNLAPGDKYRLELTITESALTAEQVNNSSGTAFPESPAQGRRFTRTDLDNTTFVYDATLDIWLGPPFQLSFGTSGTGLNNVYLNLAGGAPSGANRGYPAPFDLSITWMTGLWQVASSGTFEARSAGVLVSGCSVTVTAGAQSFSAQGAYGTVDAGATIEAFISGMSPAIDHPSMTFYCQRREPPT